MALTRTHDGKWFNEDTGELFDENPEPELVDAPPANVTPIEQAIAPVSQATPAVTGILKLANGHELDLAVIAALGYSFTASGYYKDVEKQSQAISKLVVGMSLGLSPVSAMADVSIIEGKPILQAHAVAALVANSQRYRYKILEATEKVCRIEWREHLDGAWEVVGESSFSMEDAKRAGLDQKKNWKAYPADMLYSKAMGRGARRFAPAALGGSVYVAGEIEE